MTTKLWKTMFLGAALAAFMLPAAAQNSTDNSPSTTNNPPSTSQQPGSTDTETAKQAAERKDRQQNRLANGIGDGQLTPGEASTLEQREKELNREEKRMRAANGGKLTAADKAKLDSQQDKLSKAIYKQKHDAQGVPTLEQKGTGADKSLEAQHRDRQQERIDKGLKDGSLSPAEASRLEKHQADIRQQTAEMRSQDGGKLTAADKAQIAKEQKKQSRNIHYQKHDKQHR